MPALTAFKRQWNVGSDDFVFPGVAMLIVRSLWLVAITGVYGAHHKLTSCKDGFVLQAFFIGMMGMLFLKVIINVLLIYYSSRGSIKDCGSRRMVARVLYAKATLFGLEVVWLTIGSYWATAEYENCDMVVVATVRVMVALAWIGVVVFIITSVFLFSPLGNSSSAVDASRMWRKRCQLICCTYSAEDTHTSDAYSDIADLVSGFFQDVDLVPSDIAAGLLLVGREQRRAAATTPIDDAVLPYVDRHQAIDITDSARLTPAVAPWMTVHKAAQVMPYALATYGWPLYSFTHMPFGCCVLCCTSPRGSLTADQYQGSDCCSCHLISIEKHIDGLHMTAEIYYASFTNKMFFNPFTIFLDHEQKSVVLAIRGTLSLKDALVDMHAVGDQIHEDFPKAYKAHKGMVKSARNLVERLKVNDLLRNAFSGQRANYELVVCGHSLGAGVAAIISMLLKSEYPSLKCISYSPPGGLLSEEAYKASQDYTMSVILGDDLVPRLSIQNMQDLKVRVMTALNDCSYPKYQIFCSLPLRALNCKDCLLNDEEATMNRPLVENGRHRHNSYTIETNYNSDYQEAVESRDLLRIQPPFYAPGYIMYITSTSNPNDRGCCSADSEYTWRWADQTEFLTLKVTPRMGGDHMPNRVVDVLNMLVPNYPEAVISQSLPRDVAQSSVET